jgi:PKD repeat protein
MNNWLVVTVAALLLCTPYYSSAQDTPPIRCGADEHHEEQMQDPDYAAKFRQVRRMVEERLLERSPSCVTPIIIPVAIHFSGNITNANMSCIQEVVNDQMAALNEDFGGYNADISTYCNHASNCPSDYAPTALGGGTCIQFCLATMDHPAGSGLSDGESAFTFGQYDFDSGAAPWAGYMNIFVSDIPPNGYGAGLLGVAPLNGGANPDGNGFFVTASAFGGDAYSCISGVALNNSSNYNLGRTGTHEAGHYFGLRHVFDGCGDGDGIADTPDQSSDNGGAPSINYGTCTSTANNSCGTQDFFFNFMDYVFDVSMYMFTSDQSDVMNAIADIGVNNGFNPYKSSATTCGAIPGYNPTYPTGCPAGSPPESAFTIDATAPYEYCPAMNQITFLDASTDFPTSWSWTFSGAGVSPATSTDQNPTVEVNSSGTLTVTLTAANSAGSDPSPAIMSYTITILPVVDCGDCGETVYDSGGAGGNYANNEDITVTYCTGNPNEIIQADFSQIDMDSDDDYILITSGNTAASSSATGEYLVTLSNVYVNTGGGSYLSTGNTVTSSSNCMTFRFISNGFGTADGWTATLTCLPAPTCNDLIQNQDEVFVDCGGASCSSCPTPEQGFTFYDAGGPNNPTGASIQTWQICAANGNTTVVDFSTIDMNPFNNGVMRIYDGQDNSGSWSYYVSGNEVNVPTGPMSVSPLGSNIITSTNECFFFEFFNGSVSSNGWVASVSAASILPLDLKQFRARPEEEAIGLSWLTEQEVNVERFLVERRMGSAADFTEIGSVVACGDCPGENSYRFADEAVRPGMNYTYRLKMLDRDGQYEYSNMATVKIESEEVEWEVYPNPGHGRFTLWLSDHHRTSSMVITDPLGKPVFRREVLPEDRYLDIDLSGLQSGAYQVTLISKNQLQTRTLIILP